MVVTDEEGSRGILTSQSYVSVHSDEAHLPVLRSACLAYNSSLAVYYLLLTSGRLAFYRAEVLVKELLSLPLPDMYDGELRGINDLSEVDEHVYRSFGLGISEEVLIKDMLAYTLPDYKLKQALPGWQRTRRSVEPLESVPEIEPDLRAYSEFLLQVLQATFGTRFPLSITVFRDAVRPLSIRLIALHFGLSQERQIRFQDMHSDALNERLNSFGADGSYVRSGPAVFRRVIRSYQSMHIDGRSVPTALIAKPDYIRFWTRSQAMRDADEIVLDVLSWRENDLGKGAE